MISTNVSTLIDNGSMIDAIVQTTPTAILLVGVLIAAGLGGAISMAARRGDEAGTFRRTYATLFFLSLFGIASAIPDLAATAARWAPGAFQILGTIALPPVILGIVLAVLIVGVLLVFNSLLNLLARGITNAIFRKHPASARNKHRAVIPLATTADGTFATVERRRGRFDVYHFPSGTMISDAIRDQSDLAKGWPSLESAEKFMHALHAEHVLDTVSTGDTRRAIRGRLQLFASTHKQPAAA